MSDWAVLHQKSTARAAEADALRFTNPSHAQILYADAAEEEERALAAVPADKLRTRGILSVSAAALWLRSAQHHRAEQASYRALALPELPIFAQVQLKEILQIAWHGSAQAQSKLQFHRGQVVVSVRGGEIIEGGAPLDLVLDKVRLIQAMFFRTAEYLNGLPLRRRGLPSQEIQDLYRPWLLQTPPGSYQFAVAIQDPEQGSLFSSDGPRTDYLVEMFLSILRSASSDPEALPDLVNKEDYQRTFLEITKGLAPTGKSASLLTISSDQASSPISLTSETRRLVSDVLRLKRPATTSLTAEPIQTLDGILRGLQLEQDWIEVVVANQTIHIIGVGDAVDDIIGPMVNRPVFVKIQRNGTYPRFIDIELQE